ncbi:pilus assembly PilX family protein [Teredinibacter waterburyi]|jgi:Tfp pilus assembly protein PilX|uniref:pilus assembly PilX family protein n=1 Tax=Teredinibacter waterburyi TaxID=1500538 RepID=UPI001FE9F07D|nr:PilX N-terminal domain-containing pilus assembly protein [Teredinibacter waterburyi]
MMQLNSLHNPYQHQSGATLAVALILLLVVTVLGISSVQTSLVEERMSGNLRDKHIAFEAAESALVSAEAALATLDDYPTPTTSGTNGFWTLGAPGANKWWNTNSLGWWTTNGQSASGNSLQHAAPVYILEERTFVQKGENLTIGTGEVTQGKYYYQVTARGQGGSADTRVHLRTTFIKRFD